jgi:hypothetical protein
MDICLLAYELGVATADTPEPAEGAALSPAGAADTPPTTYHAPDQAAPSGLPRALDPWAPLWLAHSASETTYSHLASRLRSATTEEASRN